jgi:hypothetical protein
MRVPAQPLGFLAFFAGKLAGEVIYFSCENDTIV